MICMQYKPTITTNRIGIFNLASIWSLKSHHTNLQSRMIQLFTGNSKWYKPRDPHAYEIILCFYCIWCLQPPVTTVHFAPCLQIDGLQKMLYGPEAFVAAGNEPFMDPIMGYQRRNQSRISNTHSRLQSRRNRMSNTSMGCCALKRFCLVSKNWKKSCFSLNM